MPKAKQPRSGSMQYWPRKRAKKTVARVRFWADKKDVSMLGFAGYKVGMTHLIITDNKPTSKTNGEDISIPATILECPPLKSLSVRFYKKNENVVSVCFDVISEKTDKELKRKISVPKVVKKKIADVKLEEFDDLTIVVHTQPKLTSIGKKKPEIFEISVSGSKEEKLNFAKEKLGKDILLTEVIKEGEQVDIHAVTKGKGVQGPVKRFGIKLKSHKSEKSRRNPGSLGGWKGHGHFMYRIAHAGRMGYHQRTEYNKWVLKIGDKAEEITPKGGFLKYGNVNNPFIILKGSIAGPRKRMIRFNHAIRLDHKVPNEAPQITKISLESKQGR